MRVERCTDLRLCHAVLRRSPFVDQALLRGDDAAGWDALQPVTAADPALFPLEDPADRLDPAAEPARQRAALAASPRAGRLGLLLAAESSGALVAAEMTTPGCRGGPTSTTGCSPSCSARARPPGSGRRCSSGCCRRDPDGAAGARRSTPTRRPSCCARCRRRGCR